ncbi:MAG: hypothetical protein PHI12_14060 [Dehalococcoidales bacterium]|nr:hypothetical protein [Dehalococcoidales bacterium]
MPSNVVKGPDAEEVWKRAVAAATDQYGKSLKTADPDKFYAIVMTIYKSMCSKHHCTPKAEKLLKTIRRLELLS